MSKTWEKAIVAGLVLMCGLFATVGFTLHDKLSEVRSERSELQTKVQSLTDSINHLKSRSDTLTVIIESASEYDVSPDMAERVIWHAKQQNVDPKIALSLVQQESGFRTNVVSHVGAVGLTQIKPSTARIFDLSVEVGELYDPDTNLEYGMKYLSLMLERYGDYETALAAYNVGPTDWDRGVNRNAGRSYARSVLAR